MNFLGLVSADEMIQSAAVICNSLRTIPCIGDGDTGYGNAMNVKRTIAKYSQAGMAGIMIEDQVWQTYFELCISIDECIYKVFDSHLTDGLLHSMLTGSTETMWPHRWEECCR